jgi:hypothetical protein
LLHEPVCFDIVPGSDIPTRCAGDWYCRLAAML